MLDRTRHGDSPRYHSNDEGTLHHKLHAEAYHPHPGTAHGAHNFHNLHGEHGANGKSEPNHHKLVDNAAHKIEKILKHDPRDYAHVFKEIDHLRRVDPKHFGQDLRELNHKLHADKILPHLELIQNDLVEKNGKTDRGYGVLSEDASLKGLHHKGTMISTSHGKPNESVELKKAYHSINHGKYDGFKVSGGR